MELPWQRRLANVDETQNQKIPHKILGKVMKFQPLT